MYCVLRGFLIMFSVIHSVYECIAETFRQTFCDLKTYLRRRLNLKTEIGTVCTMLSAAGSNTFKEEYN